MSLAIAGVCFLLLMAANFLGIRNPAIYVVLGIVMWVAVLNSGIHATIAGVLTALTIPTSRRINTKQFVDATRAVLDDLQEAEASNDHTTIHAAQQSALLTLQEASEKVQSPLSRIEHALHPWVAFAIMPIFALANAGVTLQHGIESLKEPVSFGIILGLVLGKPIGILLFTLIAILTGIASSPPSISYRQLAGAAILAGIGFTMSLFIANLAFTDPQLLPMAKVGILSGSVIAGVAGYLVLAM
jgi:NhaA family Na+:H+ antiporter